MIVTLRLAASETAHGRRHHRDGIDAPTLQRLADARQVERHEGDGGRGEIVLAQHHLDGRQVRLVAGHHAEPLAREIHHLVDARGRGRQQDHGLLPQHRDGEAVHGQQHVRAHQGEVDPLVLERERARPHVPERHDVEADVLVPLAQGRREGCEDLRLLPVSGSDRDLQGLGL
jgi:hypothetical protein